MTDAGKLIVFEGPDGVGKSKLVESCVEQLKARGLSFLPLSFPGKDAGTLGWLVDRIHHKRVDQDIVGLSDLSLQALHVAAHLDHIETRIQPALRNGEHVVLDRFWWSTWVYGRAAHVQTEILDRLIAAERVAWASTNPAQLFLVQRALPFGDEQHTERHATLSTLYSELADREETFYPVTRLDNSHVERAREYLCRRLGEIVQTE